MDVGRVQRLWSLMKRSNSGDDWGWAEQGRWLETESIEDGDISARGGFHQVVITESGCSST